MLQCLNICLCGLYKLGKFPEAEELGQSVGIFLMLIDIAKSPSKMVEPTYTATSNV